MKKEKEQPRQSGLDVSQDPRWARVLARERAADSQFWYSVSTTKVYCRPSCPSRVANPTHVVLHDTLASARATGYRPCKRCKPDGPAPELLEAQMVSSACRLLEESERVPSLNELAVAVGFSPGYFHRVFKRAVGLTPRDYAMAHRAERVRDALNAPQGRAGLITEAIYASGFNSSGRFYESSMAMLGMTPRRYMAGGPNETLHFAVGQSSLGAILVASSQKGVAAILLGNDPEALLRDLQDRFPKAQLLGADADYETMIARVVACVDAPALAAALPLDVRGTAFQRRVWQALQAIPVGETRSYREIAEAIGSPAAVRAVASACAANALAIAIPCHRVVRRDGSLSGYAWGIDRKRALLDREATLPTKRPRAERA